jgi:hypothetical protein
VESPMRPEGQAEGPSEADMARAYQGAVNQLAKREIDVPEDSDPAAVVDLLGAVEEFERAAAAHGSDSFTNSPDSSQPDDERCVIPAQRADESLAAYAERVRQAVPR